MNVILTISLLKTIVGTHKMLPDEVNVCHEIAVKDEVKESDHVELEIVVKDDVKDVNHVGLEIVVKDDVKEEDHVDYTRLFTTDKVCTYLAHNKLYVIKCSIVCALL